MALFEPIFDALNASGSRYVVVGGVAVVLYGHARLTADLDVAVDLAPEAARAVIDALLSIGLRPRAPVDAWDFADPSIRRRWLDEQGMQVFSLWDPDDPLRSVDLFVESPVEFEELYARSKEIDVGGVPVRIASIPDLIDMKRRAGRPQDLDDIEALRVIEDRDGRSDAEPEDRRPGSRDAHRREQLVRALAATPLQRLRWLEEAIAFAARAGALPREHRGNDPSRG